MSGAAIFVPETTARDAVLAMRRAFEAAGLETPDIDARFLLQDLLGVDGAKLLTEPDRPIGAAAPRLTDAMRRRVAREPVSRILGWREFFGLRFAISPDVLDPRPETETLVQLALDIGREQGWRQRAITFVDIGIGSGAIALALLAEWPLANGIGTDVSAAALAVARRNADSLGLSDRLELVEGRCLAGFQGRLDLVVSNPPYIETGEIERLADEVRLHDPRPALDGGADGLAVYREIATETRSLSGAVYVALEVGEGQAEAVTRIFRSVGAGKKRVASDLGGVTRAVALEIHC